MKKIGLLSIALFLLALPSFAARRRAMTPPGDSCTAGVIATPYFSAEVVVSDAYVYFADDGGGIFRALKGGGAVTQLVSLHDGEVVAMMIIDGDTLFFGTLDVTQTVGTIYSIPKSGGAQTMLVTGILTLYDMVIDDSSLYWVSFGTPDVTFTQFLADGRIEKASRSGANRVTLASNLSEPVGIAVDDKNVYYTETGSGLGSISAGLRSVPKNGGTVTRLTNNTTTVALVASATDLYVSTFSSNGNGSIQRIAKSGGSPTTLEQTNGVLTLALRLTPDKLYAHGTSNSSEGIRSIPLSGGPATPVVTSLLDTAHFAVDSCTVFYVTSDDSIARAPR